MTDYLIIAAAIFPALVIVAYIYFRDKNKREPIGQIWKGVKYGVGSALLTFVFAYPFTLLQEVMPVLDHTVSLIGAFFNAFFVAAVPEECAKLLVLYLLLRKNPYFDERMDGIVYAVAVGMGFAGLENILYFYDNIDSLETVGTIRALFSVPGHFCYAVFMGYYYSLAHFDKNNKRALNLFLMLAVPILLHGTFDFLLMSMPHLHPVLILMAFMAFLGLCIGMNIIAHIKMRHHIKSDKADMDAAEEAGKLTAEAVLTDVPVDEMAASDAIGAEEGLQNSELNENDCNKEETA